MKSPILCFSAFSETLQAAKYNVYFVVTNARCTDIFQPLPITDITGMIIMRRPQLLWQSNQLSVPHIHSSTFCDTITAHLSFSPSSFRKSFFHDKQVPVVKVTRQKGCIAAAHKRFNGIRHATPMCTSIQHMLRWIHQIPHPKWRLNRFSRFCTAHSKQSLYFTMGHPIRPQHCPFSGAIIHGSLGPSEFLQGSWSWQTDRQTDWQTDYTIMSATIGRTYYIHCESKKGWHPNHDYNFVNSWPICKILSLLQKSLNFQQIHMRLPTTD